MILLATRESVDFFPCEVVNCIISLTCIGYFKTSFITVSFHLLSLKKSIRINAQAEQTSLC